MGGEGRGEGEGGDVCLGRSMGVGVISRAARIVYSLSAEWAFVYIDVL